MPYGLEVSRRDDIYENRPDHAVRKRKVVRTQGDKVFVGVVDEKSRKPRRERRHYLNNERQYAEDGRDEETRLECLEHTTEIPRPPVVPEDRLKPLLAAEYRHDDEDERAAEDAERGDLRRARILVGHPLRERDLERGDDDRAHKLLEKRRKADGERPREKLRVYPYAAQPEPDDAPASPVV